MAPLVIEGVVATIDVPHIHLTAEAADAKGQQAHEASDIGNHGTSGPGDGAAIPNAAPNATGRYSGRWSSFSGLCWLNWLWDNDGWLL